MGLHVLLHCGIVGNLVLSPDSEGNVSSPVLTHSAVEILEMAKNVDQGL